MVCVGVESFLFGTACRGDEAFFSTTGLADDCGSMAVGDKVSYIEELVNRLRSVRILLVLVLQRIKPCHGFYSRGV